MTVPGHRLAAQVDKVAGLVRGLKSHPLYEPALRELAERDTWEVERRDHPTRGAAVMLPAESKMRNLFGEFGLSKKTAVSV